jgi:hypothetical protein
MRTAPGPAALSPCSGAFALKGGTMATATSPSEAEFLARVLKRLRAIDTRLAAVDARIARMQEKGGRER